MRRHHGHMKDHTNFPPCYSISWFPVPVPSGGHHPVLSRSLCQWNLTNKCYKISQSCSKSQEITFDFNPDASSWDGGSGHFIQIRVQTLVRVSYYCFKSLNGTI